MSAHGGNKAVVAALTANVGIAIAKFVAFVFTGSSSMVAEGVHSVVDSGNQVLLLIGARRARRAPDADHQFGFGRDRYIYGFLVALVIFSAGGLFAVVEGVDKVRHPHHVDSPLIAIAVLAFALLAEGYSLRTALVESRSAKGDQSWIRFIRTAKQPELPVVLLEDSAALLGLVLALLGVGIAELTGDAVWDGLATVAIGVLLVVVAVVLVVETKSLLLGESATPETQALIAGALVGGDIERVIHLRTLYLSPEEIMVAAKIALPAATTLVAVATAIDDAEARVRASVPQVSLVYLEPDIERPEPGGSGPDTVAAGRTAAV